MPEVQLEKDLESLLASKIQSQKAERLRFIANMQAVILVVIALRTISIGQWFDTALVLTAIAVIMLAPRLTRFGLVDLPVAMVLLSITAVVSLSMWHSQGLYSGALLAFPVILAVAGSVASQRLFLLLTGIMLSVVAIITYASMTGLKVYEPVAIGVGRLVVVSSILIGAAVAIALLLRDLRCTRTQLHQEMVRYRSSQARISHMTDHDPLTDLPNRQAIEIQLQQAIDRAKGQGGQLALLFVDIDNFCI